MADTEARAGNVIEALTRVIRDLPAIGKDGRADPKQGGYAYRGIEQITTQAAPLFARHGVIFTPHVRSYEVRDITVNNKPWTDTYEMVEYTVYGPGGIDDHISVGPILAIGRDNSDKGANKCMTQAYKYALLQALCIADEKDDGDAGSHVADAPPAREPVVGITSEEMLDHIKRQLDKHAVLGESDDLVKAAWRYAAPKAIDGKIDEAEQTRVLAAVDAYAADSFDSSDAYVAGEEPF